MATATPTLPLKSVLTAPAEENAPSVNLPLSRLSSMLNRQIRVHAAYQRLLDLKFTERSRPLSFDECQEIEFATRGIQTDAFETQRDLDRVGQLAKRREEKRVQRRKNAHNYAEYAQ